MDFAAKQSGFPNCQRKRTKNAINTNEFQVDILNAQCGLVCPNLAVQSSSQVEAVVNSLHVAQPSCPSLLDKLSTRRDADLAPPTDLRRKQRKRSNRGNTHMTAPHCHHEAR